MRPDLANDVGLALAGFGVMLQFVRAGNTKRDNWVVPLGLVVALVLWALGTNWVNARDWQAFGLHGLNDYARLITELFGGTFLASKGANLAVAAGMNPDHPMIPVSHTTADP